MYCASCGNQISAELKYCNRCGAKTGKEGSEDSEGKPINPLSYLITALCIIGGGGLVLLVGLIAILLDKNVDWRGVAAITTFYLLALVITNAMILWQISKMVNHQIKTKEGPQEPRPFELHAHNTNQLGAPRQPVTSVTEHTTRTLEEVLLKDR